jgi:hypothetical protein
MKKQEIIKRCFDKSKKGKNIRLIEYLFIGAIIGVAVSMLAAYLIALERGRPVSLSAFILPCLALVCLASGFFCFISATSSSIFIWRFFRPSDEEIKKYIQERINNLQKGLDNYEAELAEAIVDVTEEYKKAKKKDEEDKEEYKSILKEF